MILLIDNYDSFAHNLARYFRQLDQTVNVVRNNELSITDVKSLNPQAIVMSPGPCTPNEAGICLDVVREFHKVVPMLGVCLGHQSICQALGGTVGKVQPVHGQASDVEHNGHPLFKNIDRVFKAGRYHSLFVPQSSVPDELNVVASSAEIVMAVAHKHHPVFGVQFHPESILTTCGYQIIANFLELSQIKVDSMRSTELAAELESQSSIPLAKKHRQSTAITPHPW